MNAHKQSSEAARASNDCLRVSGRLPGSLEAAWDFVTVPGWFINDDALRAHTVTELAPGRHLVSDPVHGEFRFEDVERQEPVLYSVRGSHTGGDTAAPSTTVTFALEAVEDGDRQEVELTITETGFSLLGLDADETRAAIQANKAAWELELRLAAEALR